jgi:hypothetical protein
MAPPIKGWKDALSTLIHGGKSRIIGLWSSFHRKTIFDACATHPDLSYRLLGLRVCRSIAMKSNVLSAPKAPVISSSAAALLSVCFKLVPHHHYYCSRPIIPK